MSTNPRLQPGDQGARWLSREFADLFATMDEGESPPSGKAPGIDVLIIGSGYGGAMAASELAGRKRKDGVDAEVILIERGIEWLPGAFPARMAELTRRIRGIGKGRAMVGEQLFDLRLGGDLGVVLGNGLGGGSLINAGVMETPKPDVFERGWPTVLNTYTPLEPFYGEAQQLLGAENNTIGHHAAGAPNKFHVLDRVARGGGTTAREALLTVAMRAGHVTSGGVKLAPCKRCGDCATGCNHGAKESLDTNLLVRAHRLGAKVYCGGTALRIERVDTGAGRKGWAVLLRHTDPAAHRREPKPRWLVTEKLILAAGALGSTEILLRSQRESSTLEFSPRLGEKFSGNGDLLCFGYDYDDENHTRPARAFADEDRDEDARQIGPTITGVVDTEITVDGGPQQKIVIEEMAVPGPLRRFAEEMLTTSDTLYRLADVDLSTHQEGHPSDDPYAVHSKRIDRSMVFAAMGNDGAAGVLRLAVGDDSDVQDGQVQVQWPRASHMPLLDAQFAHVADLAGRAKLGGRTIANPLWRYLPESKEALIKGKRGAPLTVHPLGGCPMADTRDGGVVDDCGKVFDGSGSDRRGVHENLFVLDGAIVPSALSTNPALTIAALALRALRQLRSEWEWSTQPELAKVESERPVYANAAKPGTPATLTDVKAAIDARRLAPASATQIQITERLSGEAWLADGSLFGGRYAIELTLSYLPLRVRELFQPHPVNGKMTGAQLHLPGPGAQLGAMEAGGVLRVFPVQAWRDVMDDSLDEIQRERALDAIAVCHRRLHDAPNDAAGNPAALVVLRRDPSWGVLRLLRALCVWFPHHGLPGLWRGGRAVCNWLLQERAGGSVRALLRHPGSALGRWKRWVVGKCVLVRDFIVGVLELTSHAGEVRRFDYALTVGDDLAPASARKLKLAAIGNVLRGAKRITYRWPSNPWRQLTELTLDLPAGTPWWSRRRPVLKLDLGYLMTRRTPLLRVVSQPDHFSALADLASLSAYMARMLLSIHDLNMRLHERPPPRVLQRLPGTVPRVPPPAIYELDVDEIGDRAVKIRLARYCPHPSSRKGVPVLLIHGYSASGTTFAHPALKTDLMRELYAQGRDVWIVDLRTSPGMPTATAPWTFERVAMADIPAAVEFVSLHAQAPKIDVVAHCMGAAMFSMSVLSADLSPERIVISREKHVHQRFGAARAALPGRIRRAVLSQVGPTPVLTPANQLRAFVFSFASHVSNRVRYRFRPEAGEGLESELLDRLLSTLPYPDDELRTEASWLPCHRTHYQASRHRIDGLYGRSFKLSNLSKLVLDHFDDFFGPLSLETVTQVMHFALNGVVTNRGGRNRFVNPGALRRHWTFPTLCVHGAENGLADPATLKRTKKFFQDAGMQVETELFPGLAHQDCFIGENAGQVFERIGTFLDPTAPQVPAPPIGAPSFVARPPAIGPLITRDGVLGDRLVAGVGADAQIGRPYALCWVPVCRAGPNREDAWIVDPARLTAVRPHCVQVLSDQRTGDWFVKALPGWVLQQLSQNVAVFLLYELRAGIGGRSRGMPPPPVDRTAPPSSGQPYGDRRKILATLPEGKATAPFDLIDLAPQDQAGAGTLSDAMLQTIEASLDDEHKKTPVDRRSLVPVQVLRWAEPKTREPLRIALGSCRYPQGLLDEYPSTDAWQRLNKLCHECDDPLHRPAAGRSPRPELMILAGDQIYADGTAGLFDPSRADERYRQRYYEWLGTWRVRSALRRMPVLTTLDDHELDEGWEPDSCNVDDRRRDPMWSDGLTWFLRFQRPTVANENWRVVDPTPKQWFHTRAKGVPIFMLDTRSERRWRGAGNAERAELFDADQWEALKAWLLDPKIRYKPRLVVSPAVLFPRSRRSAPVQLRTVQHGVTPATGPGTTLRSDSWDGYPKRWLELLAFIADHDLQKLVFLSGDEHLGLVSTVDLKVGKGSVRVHSIHSPGLYTPFPFANSMESDLILNETVTFEATASGSVQTYSAAVRTDVVRGAGFVIVELDSTAVALSVRFDVDPGAPPQQLDFPLSL